MWVGPKIWSEPMNVLADRQFLSQQSARLKPVVAIFTATRAEYGLLRSTLQAMTADGGIDVRLIASGAHLSAMYGKTVDEIIADGFDIAARVDVDLSSNDERSLLGVMARYLERVGTVLMDMRPDLLVLLGDRYELLPVASSATILRIPIAHISGGDVTSGAIDNQIRHAVTKLSHLHFPGNPQSASRLLRMGEDPQCVHVVGEPGLDTIVASTLMPRDDLAVSLGLAVDTKWVVFTYHPETLASQELDLSRVHCALTTLSERRDLQTVITAANADPGGEEINRLAQRFEERWPGRFTFVPSLGHSRFTTLLRHAYLMMGNSSAGVVEAPAVALPVINIGDRQKGRLFGENLIACDGTPDSLTRALAKAEDPSFRRALLSQKSVHGSGNTGHLIVQAVKDYLAAPKSQKGFFESGAGDDA